MYMPVLIIIIIIIILIIILSEGSTNDPNSLDSTLSPHSGEGLSFTVILIPVALVVFIIAIIMFALFLKRRFKMEAAIRGTLLQRQKMHPVSSMTRQILFCFVCFRVQKGGSISGWLQHRESTNVRGYTYFITNTESIHGGEKEKKKRIKIWFTRKNLLSN